MSVDGKAFNCDICKAAIWEVVKDTTWVVVKAATCVPDSEATWVVVRAAISALDMLIICPVESADNCAVFKATI